jgi:hypothetical protein
MRLIPDIHIHTGVTKTRDGTGTGRTILKHGTGLTIRCLKTGTGHKT